MPYGKPSLFVAPDVDLPYDDKEAENVINRLGSNLLNGDVRIADLEARVRSVQPKLIIISSHGGPEGILLSDGFIGADLLKPILGMTDLECIYLNTCESMETASMVHSELPVIFISNIQKVPDISAFVSMSAFVHHLSTGQSYLQSWFRARPAGNSSLTFLPAVPMYMTNGKNHVPRNGDLKSLNEEMYKLSATVYGDPKWPYPGILPTISKIERRLNQIMVLVLLLLLLMTILVTFFVARGSFP